MPGLSGYRFPIQTPSDSVKAAQDAIPDDADFETIGGVQNKGLEITAAEIDITSDSSGENREILDGHGIRSHNLTVDGIVQNSVLFKALETNALNQKLRWFRVVQTDNAARKYTSKYKITSFQSTGAHDGAIQFTATLTSSGPLTIA